MAKTMKAAVVHESSCRLTSTWTPRRWPPCPRKTGHCQVFGAAPLKSGRRRGVIRSICHENKVMTKALQLISKEETSMTTANAARVSKLKERQRSPINTPTDLTAQATRDISGAMNAILAD